MRPEAVQAGPAAARRVLVLGLGNPILGDDAAGLAVAADLEARLACRPQPGVEVRTSARGGFELIDLMAGFPRAVLVDSLTVPDPVPGRIRRLALDDVAGSARLVCGHEIHVATAFDLASRLAIPMPRTVTIYGIEIADATTFGEGLTPPVAAAARELVERIWIELQTRPGEPAADFPPARSGARSPAAAPRETNVQECLLMGGPSEDNIT
ncbi:MAG TPA: hydrogenase maturation protease [Acidobacteriota bacterium]|nr:hydrogenase maturation protease [Acidobacteriota bacterium]HOT02082.1 hydrogenase maturation protease [Acidobacteriota bacterium]HQF88035.1 hydrogenase maturation protease [Acidobacteriota bacterium]HQG92155.1 hydrogenase maturation protease [Acidobacteriota bacterium]HQK89196.1 hydrogenase maturation protease [Acidobacteriota bacterium]